MTTKSEILRDIRDEKPEAGKNGFKGRTNAELWEHLIKQPQVEAVVNDLKDLTQTGIEAIEEAKGVGGPVKGQSLLDILVSKQGIPSNVSDDLYKKRHELVMVLRREGIGHKVVDELVREQMRQIKEKFAEHIGSNAR
jgi:hypothetical protein